MQHPDPLAPLLRWAADDRVDQARRRRRRQRALLSQAGQAATWRAVLVDLAERSEAVALGTRIGTVRGMIGAVGEDFCAVRRSDRMVVLIAFAATASIGSEHSMPTGFRGTVMGWTLAEALAELAHDQPLVRVHASIGPVVAGRLRRAGTDVVTIQTDDAAQRPISLNLAIVDAVTLWC